MCFRGSQWGLAIESIDKSIANSVNSHLCFLVSVYLLDRSKEKGLWTTAPPKNIRRGYVPQFPNVRRLFTQFVSQCPVLKSKTMS